MAKFSTVNTILNRVGSEVGLRPVSDPYSDKSFEQMRYLLDSAGQELIEYAVWQDLIGRHQITTAAIDSGDYTLPADFAYMIDQTGWDRTNDNPMIGPLSAQDWTYLKGRDLVSSTIYASFRLREGKFSVFPQPPPDGLDINFEYMSRNWVLDSANGDNPVDQTVQGGDTVKFETILMVKFLKAKYLEAKGFDSTKAREDFGYIFDSRLGKEESSPILNISNQARTYPYLDSLNNTSDTGYGS